jgi:hypothetical protein
MKLRSKAFFPKKQEDSSPDSINDCPASEFETASVSFYQIKIIFI